MIGFTTVYGKESGLVWDDYTKSMDQKVAGQVNEVAKRLGVKVQFADRVAGGAAPRSAGIGGEVLCYVA